MKEKKLKHFIGLLISAVIVAVSTGIAVSSGMFESISEVFSGFRFSWDTLLSLIAMISLVIALQKLIVLILSFCKRGSKRKITLVTIFQSIVSYLAAIVIICWGLTMLGVNVSTIVASVGIVALIIGFGAESLIEDVITGFFMLFENQYNVGDILEVDGFRGTVTSIGVRTTSITDPGGNIKIINNSNMKNILNRSDNASKSVSQIDIPYETDIEAFEAKIPGMMENIYKRHKDMMKSAPVYLGVSELGSSGISLKFYVEVEEQDIYAGQRILNRELLVEFRKAKVEVPFPQLDVHQK